MYSSSSKSSFFRILEQVFFIELIITLGNDAPAHDYVNILAIVHTF